MVSKRFQKALSFSSFKISALIGEQQSKQSDSFMDKKQSMYGVGGSFNEADGDEEEDSDLDSERLFGNNKVACVAPVKAGGPGDSDCERGVDSEVGLVLSTTEHESESESMRVSHFLELPMDEDVENQMGPSKKLLLRVERSSLAHESTEDGQEAALTSHAPIGHSSCSNNNDNDNKGSKSAGASFYSVTRAAQLWKKKLDAESASSTQPSTSTKPSDDTFAPSSKAANIKSPLQPTRRETFMQRERLNSTIVPLKDGPIEMFSFEWIRLKLHNPMLQSLFAWYVLFDDIFIVWQYFYSTSSLI
jgi:hypothetical protein